jgi:hypothetical protein
MYLLGKKLQVALVTRGLTIRSLVSSWVDGLLLKLEICHSQYNPSLVCIIERDLNPQKTTPSSSDIRGIIWNEIPPNNEGPTVL